MKQLEICLFVVGNIKIYDKLLHKKYPTRKFLIECLPLYLDKFSVSFHEMINYNSDCCKYRNSSNPEEGILAFGRFAGGYSLT